MRRRYTVIFIPNDKGRPFSLKVDSVIVKIVFFFVFLVLVSFAIVMLKAAEVGFRLQLVHILREENTRLKEQNKKLIFIAAKINSMEHISEYLRRIATIINDTNNIAEGGLSDIDNILEVRKKESLQYKEQLMEEIPSELLIGSIPNIRPVEGLITRSFSAAGRHGEQQHRGVDFAAAKGSLIRSTAPGIVDEIYYDNYLGLVITVQHGYGYKTLYAHCMQVLVTKGAKVERGQAIALVGNTGQSSGPHLHYEVIFNGKHIDPVKLLLCTSVIP